MDSKTRLARVIASIGYKEGDFTLASGKKSSFYLDVKRVSLHPEGAYWIGKAALEWIQSLELQFGGVGGLTLGADPIGTAISLAAWEEELFLPAFIIRKEAKGYGTLKYVEGKENILKEHPLLVVEDVTTTGGSAAIAVQRLRDEGFEPHTVLTVVDREEGGREKLEAEGVRFAALLTLSDIRKAKGSLGSDPE